MTKQPAIMLSIERKRVAIEQRHRELSKVAVRYLSDAERLELRQCNEWLKKHPRAWEKAR